MSSQRMTSTIDEKPRAFRAPGRINLIGEHTDYNGGLMMPAAIDFATTTTVYPAADRQIEIKSVSLEESYAFDLDDPAPVPRKTWTDYIQGVALQLERAGVRLPGARLVIESNVPMGAGLSSSAALEVSTAYALLARAGVTLEPTRIAQLCQRAENEFVGVRSGIMDQFTSCNARADKALMLNCRTLEARYLPLPETVRLVVCNTMVRHALAQSGYNDRRHDCEAAARLLGVQFLSELSLQDLHQRKGELPERLQRRARHVISENARVEKAAAALAGGALETFGALMLESHKSLRDDYEVSVPELDLMVELAGDQADVYGARMTGGGFGGCTINLVRADAVTRFKTAVSSGYQNETGIEPEIYVCRASAGASELTTLS